VWDNGMGIEPDKQQEIFQEFKRGTQLRAEQGLGLGLAISKGIAHVLGHQIAMHSWLGKGSVFSIELPRCEQSPSIKEVSPSLPRTNLDSLKVLCVDNEIDILHGMQSLLKRWGCDVRVALDLKASVDAVGQDWWPDVILSDYRLEDEHTGLDVLQHFRALYLDEFLGVIISADRSEVMMSSIDASGFSFLPKPVKPLKLRAMLNQMVVNPPIVAD
jgi:CheY-like chemotaxis protein